jgi:hypothetical protein
MEEDVLQAIFLHYLGVKWSVFFKQAFLSIRAQEAWKRNQTVVAKSDRIRRQWYLGWQAAQTNGVNLEYERDRTHSERYFANQLLDFVTQQLEQEEGEEEAEYSEHVDQIKKRKVSVSAAPQAPPRTGGRTKQTARVSTGGMAPRKQLASKAMRQSTVSADCVTLADEDDEAEDMEYLDEDEGDGQGAKRPMEAKQHLLHLLSTEIIVNTRLHGELSCFRTVFESWNPLLPHQTVLAILDFMGMSQKWRTFFEKFLQAPLKFTEDGPSAEPRLRRRGTPGSHTLSDVLGESVLFCLDFAVNQATDGALLYRLYDDVWFWNKDYEKCVKAWESVVRFTDVMGVEVSHDT